jgi:FkbM family methyltransferase
MESSTKSGSLNNIKETIEKTIESFLKKVIGKLPIKQRATKLGSLNNIKRLGFYPETIIDVGAKIGTPCLYKAFPDSHHILIEPIEENEPALKQVCSNLKKAEYIIAAATSINCNVDLSVSPNNQYSHARKKNNQNGWTVRQVKGITVDALCEENKLQAPYLLKIDVDGNEIDVLQGCIQALLLTEYVFVEATTNVEQRIYDIINFMRDNNFHVYDIVDFSYRPEINDLWQVDVAFVKTNSEYIPYKNYRQFTPPGQAVPSER